MPVYRVGERKGLWSETAADLFKVRLELFGGCLWAKPCSVPSQALRSRKQE